MIQGSDYMKKWWKERVVYQIYPRSFNDSNGDGIGDIQGIIDKLDYLKDLGIGLLWLSPVYKSPNYDNGYDVSDYKDIHPEYGNMNDMDLLLSVAKKRDIKIVMDLVINHTSNEHEWFIKSKKRIEPYTDYYIWRDGKDEGNPNNWTSFFAEDAWSYDNERKQYYLHLFAKQQPDLNWKNPKILEEIKSIMTFWLKKGVAGFRCDVINILYKTSLDDGKKQFALKGLEHYLSQQENHEILKTLRKEVLDNFEAFTVGETILVTPKTAHDLCGAERKELDMLFSFEHMEIDNYLLKYFRKKLNKRKFFETISKWQLELDWNANYFENHDQRRSVTRFGNDRKYWDKSAKCLATLLLCLKGSPFIYQGQEIGMTNVKFQSMEDLRDIESFNVEQYLKARHIPRFIRWNMIKAVTRDHMRTPMQWSENTESDFTTGKPWIELNENFREINCSKQKLDENSVLNYYKKLIKLRNENEIFIYGDYQKHQITSKIFVFERFNGNSSYLVLINLSRRKVKVKEKGKVILGNYNRDIFNGLLAPYEAIILKQ